MAPVPPSLFLLFFPLVAGLMLAAAIFVGALSRHRAAPWLAGVLVLGACWLVLASGELMSEDPEVKFRWYQARYLLSPFQPILFLFVVAELVGAQRVNSPASRTFWLAFPTASIPLVLTFRQHGLLRQDLELVQGMGLSWWAGRFGPAAIVVTGAIYVAGALGTMLLVRAAVRRPGVQRREYLALLGTYAFTTAFDVLFRLGLGPLPRFNLVPFAQVPTFVVLVWLLVRYRSFDVLPEMHALLVDRISSLVLVVDDTGRVLEANDAAAFALGQPRAALKGQSAAALPLFPPREEAVPLGEGPARRWFRSTATTLHDRLGRNRGTLWVFDDVTLERAREEEVRASERLREERRHALQLERLVRDIHDGVGGATASIALLASLAQQLDLAEVKDDSLRNIQHLAQEGSADVRSLLNALEGRAATWQDLLVDFRSHAVAVLERHGLAFAFKVEGAPPAEAPPLFARISLFRLFKEALGNVVKHARATRVEVVLAFSADGLALSVVDDGVGLPEGGTVEPRRGLSSMRSRARDLGGSLELRASRPSGLELRVELALPLPA